MIIITRSKKAQSFLEYSILLIVAVAVFIAMSAYLKRGFQGMIKTKADEMGDQYDPRFANVLINYAINSSANTYIDIVPASGGSFWTQRVDASNSVESKEGNSTVSSF